MSPKGSKIYLAFVFAFALLWGGWCCPLLLLIMMNFVTGRKTIHLRCLVWRFCVFCFEGFTFFFHVRNEMNAKWFRLYTLPSPGASPSESQGSLQWGPRSSRERRETTQQSPAGWEAKLARTKETRRQRSLPTVSTMSELKQSFTLLYFTLLYNSPRRLRCPF